MCRGRITLLRSVMIFCFILFPAADQETITAESGQDVTLTCRAPNNNFIVVEWRRPDLGDVFVYRNSHFDTANQHPSFKNRLDLQDRQMKDGDVSVILKDAMINDTGTYECRVFMEGTNRGKRAHQTIDPISTIYLRVVDPSVQKNITAESGQKNVTLTCRAPNNNITVVEWSRADLGDEYVLLYRDGHVESDKQHPSFMNRVDLEDRQMKDGDVSLILNNVMTADNGTYECRVIQRRTKRGKRANLKTPPISTIYLRVVDPPGQPGDTENGGKDRSIGLKVGLPLGLVVAAAAAVFVCFLIYRKVQQDSYQPPPEPV